MDILIVFNVTCLSVLGLAIGWVIMSHKIKEGPIIKLGLGLLAFSLFGLAGLIPVLEGTYGFEPLLNVITTGVTGALVIIAGIAWRAYRRPEVRKVAAVVTGWPGLDETEKEHRHV